MNQETAIAALRTVTEPELGKDLITLNLVKALDADGAVVHVTLALASPASQAIIEQRTTAALREAGFQQIRVEFVKNAPAESKPKNLPQIKNVIAVGAGKGGVGKSTVATNLAVGLQRKGFQVGLLDGDIYGPSMPTMLGVKGVQPTVSGNKLVPLQVHGLHVVTIGSMVPQDQPLIWRGPMAHGAFKQLLMDQTTWPALDYLIVDLPPGTGDVPLTLCQLLGVTGAVIVATPQQVALDDAIRAVKMFQQLGAPILGLVENMSYFVSPDGSTHDIFGRGGTQRAASDLGMPFLGELPMFTPLRVNSDAGRPHANFEQDPQLRSHLEALVTRLLEEVEKRSAVKGPTLEIL